MAEKKGEMVVVVGAFWNLKEGTFERILHKKTRNKSNFRKSLVAGFSQKDYAYCENLCLFGLSCHFYFLVYTFHFYKIFLKDWLVFGLP